MFNIKRSAKALGLATLFSVSALSFTGQVSATPLFDSGIPVGWTCVGSCGTLGANGVVTSAPAPGGGNYGWVSTNGGVSGVALPGVGGTGSATDGSTLRSAVFAANASDLLDFQFNFVTSDGAGFADYAWARLLDSANNQVALLFTARTAASGTIVPGFSMPSPAATLTPPTVSIIGGAPSWSPLGGSSGTCYSGGCGYTGWVESQYTIASAGNYILEFGVTNWNDQAYETGMAFDGITVGGTPIEQHIPEPASLALLGLGMFGLGWSRRKKA